MLFPKWMLPADHVQSLIFKHHYRQPDQNGVQGELMTRIAFQNEGGFINDIVLFQM